MERKINIPFYLKVSQITIGIVGFFFILYVGREILLPLIFVTIFAILLNPLVNLLTRYKLNRIIAITLVLLLALGFLAGLIYFLVSQASMLFDTLPALREKFNATTTQTI